MSLPESNKTNLSVSTALWILKEVIVWPAFGQGREGGLEGTSMQADQHITTVWGPAMANL